jgi:hypothetical protein
MQPAFTPEEKARIKNLAAASRNEAPAAPQISPDAARQELIRRGVIKQ